jgi:LCP family protein required for cell wall assembly
MLVRLDPDKQATALMSIPRDLKVTIDPPGKLPFTAKINAAYAVGGPRLAVATIKRVLGIDINHVVDINFRGFREGVQALHGVYADIDRRYYNLNVGTPATNYANINIQPGYQKLDGQSALDYVRFRHEDSDIVRAARQQNFLREIKDQLGSDKLISERDTFLKIFGENAQTDIRGTNEILGIFRLVAFSAGHPIREVHFRATLGPSYVTATPAQIHQSVNEFLNGGVSTAPAPSTAPTRPAVPGRRPRKLPVAGLGLEDANRLGEDQAIQAAPHTPLPFYYPRLRVAGSVYVDVPRTYTLRDTSGRLRHAYRIVVKKSGIGEYYGVQGLDWQDPPILKTAHDTEQVGGRKLNVYWDGSRIRLVAWHTRQAVYWISNTLILSVTNKQMVAIAASLKRIG